MGLAGQMTDDGFLAVSWDDRAAGWRTGLFPVPSGGLVNANYFSPSVTIKIHHITGLPFVVHSLFC